GPTLFKGLKSPSDLATFRANSESTAASKSNPRNWFGRSPSHTLRAAEFRHDLIMARTYYGKRWIATGPTSPAKSVNRQIQPIYGAGARALPPRPLSRRLQHQLHRHQHRIR